MTEFELDRRKVLTAGGAALTIGVAGCLGDDDDDGNGVDDDVPDEVDDYLSDDANEYDGSIEDMTGQDSVTIDNGINGPDYAFGPAAVRIDAGTEVTWDWVSDGHTVTVEDGPADFDTDIENEGFEYSYTFDEEGIVLYKCTPHEAVGHLGAVVVE